MRPAPWTALLASALVLLAVALGHSLWTAPRLQAMEQERAMLDQASRRARSTDLRAAAPARPLSAQLLDQSDGRALPARLPARLSAIQEALTRARLTSAGTSYQVLPSEVAGVSRHLVQLDATGPYVGLRFFLRSVLAADPLVALQAVDLRREPSAPGGPGLIRVTIQLVLFQAEQP